MPFKRGAPKPSGSGRRKGTLNRITGEVAARLAELSCDPIEGMAAIAADTRNSVEVRARMYAELAQYIHPKRRAVESRLVDSQGKDRYPLDLESVRAYCQNAPSGGE